MTAPPDITQLYHVTLTTGQASYIPHHIVDEVTIRRLRRSLISAMDLARPGRHVRVPGHAGFDFNVTVGAAGLIATIWTTADREPVPAVTFGVAPVPEHAAPLWRALHAPYGEPMAEIPFKTDVDRPPAEPWIAARIEIGITTMAPADQLWLATFEAQLAWTWIESTKSLRLHHRPRQKR